MPSFDTVSELDMHEVTNAIDQAKRELGNRWDMKNVETDIVLEKERVIFSAEADFQLDQLIDMLRMAIYDLDVILWAISQLNEAVEVARRAPLRSISEKGAREKPPETETSLSAKVCTPSTYAIER